MLTLIPRRRCSMLVLVVGSGEYTESYMRVASRRFTPAKTKTLADLPMLGFCSTPNFSYFFFLCAFSIIGTSNMCVQQARTDYGMDKNKIRARARDHCCFRSRFLLLRKISEHDGRFSVDGSWHRMTWRCRRRLRFESNAHTKVAGKNVNGKHWPGSWHANMVLYASKSNSDSNWNDASMPLVAYACLLTETEINPVSISNGALAWASLLLSAQQLI